MFDLSRPSTFEQYMIEGDTVVADRTWKKLYLTQDGVSGKELISALYEENGQVWFLPYAGAEEGRLLYDFGLSANDRRTYYNITDGHGLPTEEAYRISETYSSADLTVMGVTEVETCGRTVQALYMSHGERSTDPDDSGRPDFTYMETIGCTIDPFRYIIRSAPGSATHVVECHVAGETLYEAALWVQADGVANVMEKGDVRDMPAYDLSGRRLDRIPRNGIYIQGGRKFVAK